MPETTTDQLAAIEARTQAASPGPWNYATGFSADGTRELCTKAGKAHFVAESLNNERDPLWVIDNQDVIPAVTGDGPKAKANAEFIAHAITDVPALLALVREQAAKLKAVDEKKVAVGLRILDREQIIREQAVKLDLIANQTNAAEMLCRMNGWDPELATVPAAAIRAALTATEGA